MNFQEIQNPTQKNLIAFFKLDEDKQTIILNACFAAFSQPYKNVSTNAIIEQAQISKGSLFYYFKNKKYLADFLFYYCTNHMIKHLHLETYAQEQNLLLRIKKIVFEKFILIRRYPSFLAAFSQILSEKESLRTKARSTNVISNIIHTIYYDNINESLFLEEIDIKRACTFILNSLENPDILQAFIEIKSIEDITIMIQEHLRFLAQIFYKPEHRGSIE